MTLFLQEDDVKDVLVKLAVDCGQKSGYKLSKPVGVCLGNGAASRFSACAPLFAR